MSFTDTYANRARARARSSRNSSRARSSGISDRRRNADAQRGKSKSRKSVFLFFFCFSSRNKTRRGRISSSPPSRAPFVARRSLALRVRDIRNATSDEYSKRRRAHRRRSGGGLSGLTDERRYRKIVKIDRRALRRFSSVSLRSEGEQERERERGVRLGDNPRYVFGSRKPTDGVIPT